LSPGMRTVPLRFSDFRAVAGAGVPACDMKKSFEQ
jgi:hypothetical protein